MKLDSTLKVAISRIRRPAKAASTDSLVWKAGVAAITKAGTFLLNIFLLPAQARWLSGRTEAGVWLSLVALAMSMMLLDFGIGQGVKNSVASFMAKEDDESAQEVISSSYVMLAAIVLPSGVAASIIAVNLDWGSFLRTPESLAHGHSIQWVALILTWSIVIYLLMGIINAALSAAELTQWPPIVSFVSNLLVLGAISVLPRPADPASAIVAIAVIQGICMVLPLIIATAVVYGRILPRLRPSISKVRRQRMHSLIRPSMMFLVIQVGILVLLGINEPLITRIDGPSSVFTYQAYYKIFSMIWISYGIIVSPVWARMASTFHRGDHASLIGLHRTMHRLAFLAAVGTVVVFFAVPYVMNVWLGQTPPHVDIRYAFLFQTVLMVAYYAETCVANATNRLRTQTLVLGVGALAKIPISLILGHLTGSWTVVLHVNSAILATLVCAQFAANRSWLRDIASVSAKA